MAPRKKGNKSAILIIGGGSPKNFVLQTEPQIQEVLGLDEKGHDYYLQFTDARVGYRRPFRRDAGRSGHMGQGRSRPVAGCRRLLHRFDRRAAAADCVCHGETANRGR